MPRERRSLAGTVGSANQGMHIAVHSRDLENQAWQKLQREAEAYNTAIRRFPTCLIAHAFGFRPWSFGGRGRR